MRRWSTAVVLSALGLDPISLSHRFSEPQRAMEGDNYKEAFLLVINEPGLEQQESTAQGYVLGCSHRPEGMCAAPSHTHFRSKLLPA